MSLRGPERIQGLNTDFCGFDTSDRGGLLSTTTVSGVLVLRYIADPTQGEPMGLQYNDIEFTDRSREYEIRRLRRVDEPYGIVGALTDGEIWTNWILPSGNIQLGGIVYVGPSGFLTDDPSYGGKEFARFLSQVTDEPSMLIYQGRGLSYARTDCFTKNIEIVNDPADRVLLFSPGFVKVRLNRSFIK